MSLGEATFDMTEQAMGGSSARYAADNTLLVKFFLHSKLNDGKSAEEGRPIFEDVPYIQIMQPGNKDSIIVRPATPMDKNRFAEHYRRFEARMDEDELVEGTRLEEWPILTRAQVDELKYLNIRTVEQLANVSDTNAQGIMGLNMLKKKAASYIENAKDAALTDKLAAQDDEIAELRAQLAELVAEKPKPKAKAKAKAKT